MSSHFEVLTPAARLLGREVLSIDAEASKVRVRFEARDEFTNRHGTVQGGLLAAMLDSAAGNAVFAALPDHLTAVTMRLDTRFVAPASPGELTAVAWVVRRCDRSADVQAELMGPDGCIVATASAEMRIRSRHPVKSATTGATP